MPSSFNVRACDHVCQVHTEHTPCMIYSSGLQGEWPRERLAPSELITSWFWFPPTSLPSCHTYCMSQSMKAVWLLRNRAGQVACTFAPNVLFSPFYPFFITRNSHAVLWPLVRRSDKFINLYLLYINKYILYHIYFFNCTCMFALHSTYMFAFSPKSHLLLL